MSYIKFENIKYMKEVIVSRHTRHQLVRTRNLYKFTVTSA